MFGGNTSKDISGWGVPACAKVNALQHDSGDIKIDTRTRVLNLKLAAGAGNFILNRGSN
jgi:hypothetical protein